jgi:phosphohistidine phosphatase SixA
MIRAFAGAAAVLLALVPLPAIAADTIYVMRHLQKGAGDDPALTSEGTKGAAAVAKILGSESIAAVFATPTRRAQQTGAPLAAKRGIAVTLYDPGDPQKLATAVAAVKGAVLIVGHSNTVPDLVAMFGGDRPAPLADSDYGTIYVLVPGKPQVRQMHLPAAASAMALELTPAAAIH